MIDNVEDKVNKRGIIILKEKGKTIFRKYNKKNPRRGAILCQLCVLLNNLRGMSNARKNCCNNFCENVSFSIIIPLIPLTHPIHIYVSVSMYTVCRERLSRF